MPQHDFLFEIGCEELPPIALTELSQQFKEGIEKELTRCQLSYQKIQSFATTRRLAILITDLATTQPPQFIERQGPNIQAAFDKQGMPTLACLGFARSCHVSTDQLEIRNTKKGDFVYCRIEKNGDSAKNLLPEIIENSLKQMPIRKPMRWGNHSESFVRPVHWIVSILDKTILPLQLFGLSATSESVGHRFHYPKKIHITHPKEYLLQLMTTGMVIADFDVRREKIKKLIKQAAEPYGQVVLDEALLNEVTAIVEWPVALCGQFKSEFLKIPPEVLMMSMKIHQRCFPIRLPDGSLQPYFIIVSNIESKNPRLVIEGNERVINARLADAAFFYHNDLQKPLIERLKKLKSVVFQKELSHLGHRAERLANLSEKIGLDLHLDPSLARRAALLAKCDLVSEMVYEFPDLQGIMGYYYALHDQEPVEVAEAIKEHYFPRFSGDQLPQSIYACCVSLSDRLDTLIGIFGINKIPTGDKDPFALRRAALGILRLLIEKKLPLDLYGLLKHSYEQFSLDLPNTNVVEQVYEFMMERLRAWYVEKGISAEVIASVLAKNPTQPLDFDHRIQAVTHFQLLKEASALAAANKRVSNILKKLPDMNIPEIFDQGLFESESEKKLGQLLQEQSEKMNFLYQHNQYTDVLSELAQFKEPVDRFFDEVMVMVEDKKIRDNRLALLNALRQLFTKVADISLLP